jgi:hypothetical protein
MYSHEIKKLLELRNNLVSLKEYYEIIKSTQVDHVKYENEKFHIWTTDGYEFKLQIRKER